MKIEIINYIDLESIVRIHEAAFNGFFLTELGDNFLKTYYNSIIKSKEGLLLGYFDNNILCGFCAATSFSNGFNKRLIKTHLWSYFLTASKLLFSNPKSLIRLFKNFTKKSIAIQDKGVYAELLSIGVDPNVQGSGVGKQLLSALEKQLIEQGIKQLSLTTDYYNNDKAIGFYKSLGYKIMYEFVAYPNRKMYRLIKNL